MLIAYIWLDDYNLFFRFDDYVGINCTREDTMAIFCSRSTRSYHMTSAAGCKEIYTLSGDLITALKAFEHHKDADGANNILSIVNYSMLDFFNM